MVPDLRIALRPDREGQAFAPGGGTALAVAEPIEAITLIEEEIHESYIEIVDRVERLVVTVIEILSPTNKVAGSRGRESYETKRLDIMRSPSHLVEIDFLRRGLPIPVYGGIPPHEYLVHVSRAGRRPKATLWPIRLSQKLLRSRSRSSRKMGTLSWIFRPFSTRPMIVPATISSWITAPTPFRRSKASGTPGRIAS